ncbi:MAG TPA: hypothetical protein VJS64_16445, partial [Pyrinomonadaceae bacterium]|nr:hypothetical protein [Pyrinomonadaceae bacterium]
MKFRALLISLLFVAVAIVLAGSAGARPLPGDDEGDEKVERSIAVDPTVAVSLCMASGNIIVRGWDRNEVRARSVDDVKIELAHAPAATPNA